MNCERVDELLPAYALDAVDKDERLAIEAHFAGCDQHPDLVELRAVALALAELPPERQPPPALEARLLAAAEGSGRSLGVRWRRKVQHASGWPAVAAVLATVVIGLAAWSVSARGAGESPALVYVYQDGESWMRVESEPGPALSVALDGLVRQPDSQTFQLWAIRDGRWLSIGTFNTNAESRWRGEFTFSLQREDAIALTVEPAGGSAAPGETRVFAPRQ